MKARLAFADVVAEAACLHDMLVGGRLINIYDCDDKTFVLKFSRPHAVDSSDDNDRDKVFVIIESGVRVHSTAYARAHADSPSGFVAKLRKHIRGWRCTDITVRGLDRVLDLTFGAYHIVVELYDRGNVLLCEAAEAQYRILSLLRVYTLPAAGSAAGEGGVEGEEALRVAARQMYPLGPPLREMFTSPLALLEAKDAAISLAVSGDDALGRAVGEYVQQFMARPDMIGKKRRKMDLNTCLMWKGSGCDVYGGALIQDALVAAGMSPHARLEDVLLPSADKATALNMDVLTRIAAQLRLMPARLESLTRGAAPAYAYVRVRDDAQAEAAAGTLAAALSGVATTASASGGDATPALPALPTRGCMGTWAEIKAHPRVQHREEHAFDFIDFTPARFAQYEVDDATPYIVFDSFDALCDAVFSRTDVARAVKVETAARTAALKRVEKVKEGTREALTSLTQAQQHALTCARLIESHAASVDAVSAIVRSALSSGMDWGTFTRIIAAEAAGGNACARMIVKTDMKAHVVTVSLTDESAFADAREGEGSDGDSGEDGSDEDATEDETGDEEAAPSALPAAETASTAAEEPTPAAGHAEPKRAMAASSRTQREALARSRARAALQARKAAARAAKKSSAGGEAAAAAAGPPTGAVHVDINVDLSAHANAGVFYESAKRAVVKMEKTVETGAHALKRAEKSVSTSGNNVSVSSIIKVARKPAWYERFAWFISSEGYIVIAGRNAHDNEALVKRYLRACDVYVHADVHGAATVIVRNVKKARVAESASADGSDAAGAAPAGYGLVPPYTLSQAGAFCVCLSAAWNAHIPTSAWWVQAHQVSKTAPTGEYLGTGSFMIRGRKNVLPHTRLELGLCVLFRVDDTCVEKHAGDRYVRGRVVEEVAEDDMDAVELGEGGKERLEDDVEGEGDEDDEEDGVEELNRGQEPEALEDTLEVQKRLAFPTDRDATWSVPDEDAAAAGMQVAEETEGSPPAAAAVAASPAAAVVGVPIPPHIRKRAKRLQATGMTAEAALARARILHAERPVMRVIEPALAAAAPVPAHPAPAPQKESKFKSKRRAKYAEQDDDDRAQAEAVIGHAFTHAPAPPPAGGVPVAHPRSAPAAAARGGRGDAKGAPSKPAQAAVADEDDAPVRMDDDADTAGIAALVGVPHADDVLLHAFTMLCPYSVALECKYRVKLVPGALKKGKAARTAMEAFVSQAGAFARSKGGVTATAREKDLLRALSEPETITTIIGNVRVAAAAAFAGSGTGATVTSSAAAGSSRRAAGAPEGAAAADAAVGDEAEAAAGQRV